MPTESTPVVISCQPSALAKLHRHTRGLHILSYQSEPREISKNNCSEIVRSLVPLPPYNNRSNQRTDEVVCRLLCSKFLDARIFLKLTQKFPCSRWVLSASHDPLCKTLHCTSWLLFLPFGHIAFCNPLGQDLERQDCKPDIFRIFGKLWRSQLI